MLLSKCNQYSPKLILLNQPILFIKMKKQKDQTLSTQEILSSQKLPDLQSLGHEILELHEQLSEDHGHYAKDNFHKDLFDQLINQNNCDQQDNSFQLLLNDSFAVVASSISLANQKNQQQILIKKNNPTEQLQSQDQSSESKKSNVENKDFNLRNQKNAFQQRLNLNIINQTLPLIFKKNVNMPKAIGRYLIKYHQRFRTTLFQNNQQYFDVLSKQLQDLHLWIKKSKKNTFRLKHLVQYFNNPSKTIQQCKINRFMMREMLFNHLRQEIIPNQQVKDKKEYLVGLKVYALRCANAKLATRMQMR